ncbi:MAG: MBG domain-containing protein [Acidobacteriaceae bacterium]
MTTLLLTAGAQAATYTVTTTADSGTGSLRAAITSVNGDTSADTIDFAAGVTGTITPQTPLPAITNDVTITGPGAGKLSISGSAVTTAPIFTVNSGVTVSISGLTLSGAITTVEGGAIASAGTLTVSSCAITNDSGGAGGGGIFASGGTLAVSDSTFSGNSGGAGGAIGIDPGATATITNSTFYGNNASLEGGAIYSNGTLTITNSTISANSATNSGGGINSGGTLTLANTIVAGNSAAASNDMDGTYTDSGGNQVNESAATINLAALGNYGGVLETMLPLPGSPAICGGLKSVAKDGSGNSLTTDERGFSFGKSSYCTGTQVDSGAVQSDYTSIQFTNANSTYGYVGVVGQAVATPKAPNVSVTENAQNIGGVPVTLTEGSGTAIGLGPVTTTAGAGATFSTITVGTADASDTLSASLPIVSGTTLTTGNVGLVIEPPITLVSSLPGAIVGSVYSQSIVSGGTAPYTDKVTSGSLPSTITFGSDGTLSGTPKTVTNYTFGLTVQDNYGFSASANYTLAVTKGSATLNLSGLNQTYTGSPLPVTVTTTPSGLTVDITYTGTGSTVYAQSSTAPTNAGTYSVTATVNDGNYSGSTTAAYTIAKANANVTLSNLNQTYTGSALPVTVTATPNGLTIDVTYTGTGGTTYGPSSTAPTSAGTYSVTATVDATADPNYTGSANGVLTIAKGNVTLTLNNLNQTFGSPLSVTVSTNPAGLTVDLSYVGVNGTNYPQSSTQPTNAGTYSVTATVDATADPNYSGSVNGVLTIAKESATITLGNLSDTFGSVVPVTVSTNPTGLTVDVTYSGNGYGPSSTEPVNAGTYTVSASVDATADPNFTGSATAQLQIAKANATVSLSNLVQVYTGSQVSVTTTTVPAGLAVTVTYNGSTNLPINAGTYSVIATIADTNYQGSATAQLVIENFALSASSSGTINVTQGFASASGVSGVQPDPFTPQAITVTPTAVAGYTPNLNLTCTVSPSTAPSNPTLPACLLNDSTSTITGDGVAPVSLTINASGATPGIYAVALQAVDPTTQLTRTSTFTVNVRSASTPLTLQSGATTGNSATVSYVLPANVSLSGLSCTSIAGPTLTAPVDPGALSVACSLNPSSIASSTSIQEAQVTVTVSTGTTTTAQLDGGSGYLAAGVLGIPLLGLFGLLGGRRKSSAAIFRVLLIAGIVIGAMQLSGCGGSFTRTTTVSGSTPPGSYSVLVQGTGSDNQTYQAVVQLNVTR